MAKIENISNGPREIHALRTGTRYVFTAARISEDGKQTRINGTGEIPDDVLNDLLERDTFTKGLFANGGDLVRVGAPTPSTVESTASPVTPVTPVTGGDTGEASKGEAGEDDKGKGKKK